MKKRTRFVLLALLCLTTLALLAGCSPKRVKKTEEITHGIDVARYQGTIDWQKVAAAGVDFAMVRVGYRTLDEGVIVADSNARYNMQEAQQYGIKLGAYFFSTAVTEEEAIEEADWVADYISRYSITYPVAYNCEGFAEPNNRQYALSKAERTDLALVFLKAIEKHGYEPMFYASKNEMEADAKWETSRIQEDYMVWVAQYPEVPYPDTPASSYSGTHQMWQYTREGSVDGITQSVDLDVAYFGYEGINEPMSDEPVEIAYPDPEALLDFTETIETVTAKIEVNLRSLPSQDEDSQELYLLKNGETAVRTGYSDTGWSRLEFKGQTYYAVSSMLTTDMDYDPSKASAPDAVDTDGDGLLTEFRPVNETVTAKEEVNLRSLPSTENPECEIIYLLKNGETVTRTGIDERWGWSRLEYRGETCYAISSMLTTEVGANPTDMSKEPVIDVTMAFTETYDAVTARIKVNLRNMPSTEDPRSEVVHALVNGEVAVRTGIAVKGEWARVEYKGQTLYCINNYLEKTQ